MGVGALVPLGVFVGIVGTVGWRLLARWRRTRERPELILGLALVLLSCSGLPGAVLGRLPSTAETFGGKLFFAAGIQSIGLAAVLLLAFTRHVFRRDVAWAKLALAVGCVVALASTTRVAYLNYVGETLAQILPLVRPAGLPMLSVLALGFVWSSLESFAYQGRLKRQLAIGLSDPVLANRFFLWGLAGAASTAMMLAIMICMRLEMVIFRDAIPLVLIAITGTGMSVTWYLTFLAPESYQRFVRERANEAAD